jgi:hypothetical protein
MEVAVFSLKQFIEGFVADILRLPVMYVRSHNFVLRRGVRGAYQLERLAVRGDRQFLSLRAIAIINVVLIFAVVQALNDTTNDAFGIFASSIFKPDGILNPQFSRTLAAIVMIYCLYYLAVHLIVRRPASSGLFASSAIYFASLSLLLYFVFFLLAFSYSGNGTQYIVATYGMRFCILATYTLAFWQTGAAFYSRLRWTSGKVPRPIATVGLGLLCFGIYLVSLRLCLGNYFHELLWPSLAI